MREGLWRTKKGGQNKSKLIPKKPKMLKNGIWEVGEAVPDGAQAFFPGDNGRNGAQIQQMPMLGLRNSLSAGKYMYHEENLRPDKCGGEAMGRS